VKLRLIQKLILILAVAFLAGPAIFHFVDPFGEVASRSDWEVTGRYAAACICFLLMGRVLKWIWEQGWEKAP